MYSFDLVVHIFKFKFGIRNPTPAKFIIPHLQYRPKCDNKCSKYVEPKYTFSDEFWINIKNFTQIGLL